MKKKTLMLTIMLVLFSLSKSFAQCKVENDPITNEKVASFKYNDIFLGRAFSYNTKDGGAILQITLNYGGELNTIISQGTELIFKLENGGIIKSTTISDAAPKTKISGHNYITTDYTYIIQVNKEDLTKIAAGSKVVLIRYPNGKGGTVDLEPKKMGTSLSKGAKCMLDNL